MDKFFIITIDTEGDNLWNVSDIRKKIETKNAAYLFRFQELCEKYGFIPTYLTNYEMSCDKNMIELGREGIKKGTLEIGMHEHAWNQPPFFPLIKRWDKRGKPYLGEYPEYILRKKLEYLTHRLEDVFQCDITSHRGGRWYLDARIIRVLDDLGYVADCTCTPGYSWSYDPGWSPKSKGTDWSGFKKQESFRFSYNIKGNRRKSMLLEVPVTTRVYPGGRLAWVRPDGTNTKEMISIIDERAKQNAYVEFMLHSSEMMPGGSPLFEKKWQITRLYDSLETIFKFAKEKGYEGIGLSGYAKHIIAREDRI